MKAFKIIDQNGKKGVKIAGHVFITFGFVGFGFYRDSDDFLGSTTSVRLGLIKILIA